MVELFYTTYISVDLAHQVIFHAKVGKGDIKLCLNFNSMYIYFNENCVLVTYFKTWGFVEHF